MVLFAFAVNCLELLERLQKKLFGHDGFHNYLVDFELADNTSSEHIPLRHKLFLITPCLCPPQLLLLGKLLALRNNLFFEVMIILSVQASLVSMSP